MKFIDLFSGIGGFRLGMERAGHECVGHVEIDKFANLSYEAIFGKSDLIGTDIREVTNEEWRKYRYVVECLCGGFPCQPFSISGKRKGFHDDRGGMFQEICRAIKEIKPKYVFLENVKGLLTQGKGEAFSTILKKMDELGYNVEWCVLNSKDFGVPQNRERVYIIGHNRERCTTQILSIGESSGTSDELFEQATTNTITARYGNSISTGNYIIENKRLHKIIQLGNINESDNFNGNGQTGRVYSVEGISPTLNTMQGGNRQPKIFINGKIRKLTPRECWRLQGFPDEAFDKASKVNSDSQLYKQAGNAVTVNVIQFIAELMEG